MASKNTAGNMYARTKAKEERLIDKIDYRDKTGKNMENIDHVWQNHHTTDQGERVWSF